MEPHPTLDLNWVPELSYLEMPLRDLCGFPINQRFIQ